MTDAQRSVFGVIPNKGPDGQGGLKSNGHASETSGSHEIERVTISDGRLTVSVLSFGAIIQDIRMESYDHSLVLGFDDLDSYLADGRHIGAVAGRVANRIGGATMRVNGKNYDLDANVANKHSIHGGCQGLGRQIWRFDTIEPNKVSLIVTEPDEHMGYPGPCTTEVIYHLPGDGVLRVDFRAVTETATPVSLTQHSYFNLDGASQTRSAVLDISANKYVGVDDDLIATGELMPLDGCPFDFRIPKTLSEGGAFHDRSYVLQRGSAGLRYAARMSSAGRGPYLEVWTNQPIMHLYDGRDLPEGLMGADGRTFGPYSGVCFEAHGFPNSVNVADFPKDILWPGELYTHRVEYRFHD